MKKYSLILIFVVAATFIGSGLADAGTPLRLKNPIINRILKAPPSQLAGANLCINPDLIGNNFDESKPISKFIMWEPDRDDPQRADFEYLIGRAGFDDDGDQIFEGRRCQRRKGRVFNEFGKFRGALDSGNQRFSGSMLIYGCCGWSFGANFWVDSDTPAGLVEWKSVPPIIVDEGGFTEGVGIFWQD